MKPGAIGRIIVVGALLFCLHGFVYSNAWGGSLRITMNDGTFVDVPYYWEEGGDIKFEIAGGVAGVPKSQVASINEVITAGEFDPEVLVESTEGIRGAEERKRLQDLIVNKVPLFESAEKLSTEESLQLLRLRESAVKESGVQSERIYAPLFNLEEEFAELVRPREGSTMLVIRNILSSRTDLKNQRFTAAFYDGEGNLLQKKPCEVQELDVDQKTLRKMGMRGRLFSVTASVRPDPNIKRYEITAVHQ